MNIAASFMLGIPGETVADMEATYKFAKSWVQTGVHSTCSSRVHIAFSMRKFSDKDSTTERKIFWLLLKLTNSIMNL